MAAAQFLFQFQMHIITNHRSQQSTKHHHTTQISTDSPILCQVHHKKQSHPRPCLTLTATLGPTKPERIKHNNNSIHQPSKHQGTQNHHGFTEQPWQHLQNPKPRSPTAFSSRAVTPPSTEHHQFITMAKITMGTHLPTTKNYRGSSTLSHSAVTTVNHRESQ
ncbi:hypothetical protein M0R45_009268 [Rubus argutus]|uniref:Uncharacterized protein n=1 Tax=Rubus argutus TaxID=59490 RepID=A0AAW1Y7G4_RUBAR